MREIIETKYGKICGIKKTVVPAFWEFLLQRLLLGNWQKISQKTCASEKWNFGVHLVRL